MVGLGSQASDGDANITQDPTRICESELNKGKQMAPRLWWWACGRADQAGRMPRMNAVRAIKAEEDLSTLMRATEPSALCHHLKVPLASASQSAALSQATATITRALSLVSASQVNLST